MKLVALSVGRATLRAEADGNVATRQVIVVEDVRGDWIGYLTFTTCRRVAGEGPGVCKTPETRYRYEFRVNVQNGDELTTSASIGSGNLTHVTSARLDERGGFLMAASTVSSASEWGPIMWTMTEATGQLVGSADGTQRLEARLVVERQWTSAWGPQHYKDECTIELSKQAGPVD